MCKSAAVPLCFLALLVGCRRPEITAVPLSPWNQSEQEGIPFYLPKPLLIVAKNFRYIEEPKVGLTDSAPIPTGFDDQAKYADVNARTNFTAGTTTPSPVAGAVTTAVASPPRLHSAGGAPVTPYEAPSDGLSPETFYTYQIVFIPDMAQKYGLKVRGGAGEIRAAMNLVNGWQFTGLGPYYMKDSSTAQNILSSGIFANLAASGVADVVESVAGLAGELQTGPGAVPADSPAVQRVAKTIQALDLRVTPITLPNFAQIHVYEPQLTPDGRMEWIEIVCLSFDREALGYESQCNVEPVPAGLPTPPLPQPPQLAPPAVGQTQTGVLDPVTARAVVAGTLGIPLDSPALWEAYGPALQAGPVPPGAMPGVTQVQVDCDRCDEPEKHEFNLFKLGGHHHCERERPQFTRRAVYGVAPVFPAPPPSGTPPRGTPLDQLRNQGDNGRGETDGGDTPIGNP